MSELDLSPLDDTKAPGSRPRILVVDDDPVTLQMVAAIFEGDHEVVLAGSAEEALEACQSDPPELLLLDIVMPGLDGLETCRRLHADPSTRDIPVIFITSQESPQEETRALGTGGVDFITKPVNPAVVRARVKTHLTLKAQSDILRNLAFLDGLTGLANRRRFDEALASEWRRGQRNGTPLTLLMADIDRFKHYNDRYGHLAGDACLREVARAFQGAFRRAQDLVARYGGEEFVCLLPETPAEGGRVAAEAALDAVRRLALPHEEAEGGIVTLSLGVATMVPKREANPAELIAQADARLYEAKTGGRNRAVG